MLNRTRKSRCYSQTLKGRRLENTRYSFKASRTLTTPTLTMGGRSTSPTGGRRSRTSMHTWLSEKSSAGSGNGSSSKSSLRRYSPGRTVIHHDPRKCSEPRTMTSLDYQRLGNFRYAVITMVGDDGFPFSVATDFKILPDKMIVLRKPALPSKLDGKRVNVLFNHITGLPAGGYSDQQHQTLKVELSSRAPAKLDKSFFVLLQIAGS